MPKIIYEITATVSEELCDTYESYMIDRHIPDLMNTGCFVFARFDRAKEGSYRIRYESLDQSDLDTYFESHAPALRKDLTEHFPEGVELSREILEEVAIFEK